jgi:hypothetical protein
MTEPTRPLTDEERTLLRWMLEHSGPEAAAFLPQLEHAEATLWKCPCGCASFDLKILGYPEPPRGARTIAEFVFGEGETFCGIFVFEDGGTLKGVDAYALGGKSPNVLPRPEELRPFDSQ